MKKLIDENYSPTDDFVHLHLHTQYSLLDGAIRIRELILQAQQNNMWALAQTDHGNMFGAIDFYTQCKKAGIRPILGSEVYFTSGSRFDRKPPKKTDIMVNSQDEEEGKRQIHHLVLLAKNKTGFHNLCKLISYAYMEGFYYKPRTDLELIKKYSEGLVALSACLKGEVSHYFCTGQDQRAHKAILGLREIYGDDFYLEIQENGLSEQQVANQKIIAFSKERSIPVVATNDCHYLYRDDALAHEVLLCVQTGKTFSNEKRMKLTSNEFYFKSIQEMRRSFHYFPEACDNTIRVANQCNLEFNWNDSQGNKIYHLPHFKIESEESTASYFQKIAYEGLYERFEGSHFKKSRKDKEFETVIKQRYEQRLADELSMIVRVGFDGYFLIVWDFIKWAREKKIAVGPGRGSGAGSLVAYALKITNIDPLPFNLLFERFINPERISLPDFDIDFCQERRGEVIQYVTQKYGHERVGQIITFGKMQAKLVLRDVSRVFDLPYKEADMLAKLVPDELKITLEEAIKKEPKLQELEKKDPKVRQILKISRRLEGLMRHASIHAAGVVITNLPLVDYAPLFRGKEGEQVVQFDKDFSDLVGLVKFDFLGLKTLTVIDKASKFIKRDHDSHFDIEDIDLADKEVYKFISSGDTVGVFQLESAGMRDLCKRLAPDNLEDITAVNALYRPGPLGSGMVDDFVEIKHGRKETSYPFKELKPVLKDTYGIIIYQEQVMHIARLVAGYSLGQADILRKAMGKKKKEVMDQHRQIFHQGALKNGFDGKKALELYDLMSKFAEYGFNKSHAMAYALIAFQTAYLKYYYPASFFAALLSTELNNTDKVKTYIRDAKNCKVEILPPSINESNWHFNVINNNIRFGLGAIKNVGEAAIKEVILERQSNGPFKGLLDFCKRAPLKTINKRVLESMIKVGVFDDSEKMNRRTIFENLETITNYASKYQEDRNIGQSNLFDVDTESFNSEDLLSIQEFSDWDKNEKLMYEYELMGIYVSGHPLEDHQCIMEQMSSMNISAAHEIQGNNKRSLVLSGMISSYKNIITKKGDRMAFATLEDMTSKIECVIFPKTYAQYATLLDEKGPLIVEGEINLAEDPRKFFPQKLAHLQSQTEEKVVEVRINVPLENLNEYSLFKLKEVLTDFRGTVGVNLVFESMEGKAKLPLGEDYLVNPTPRLATKVNEIMSCNSVKFITP